MKYLNSILITILIVSSSLCLGNTNTKKDPFIVPSQMSKTDHNKLIDKVLNNLKDKVLVAPYGDSKKPSKFKKEVFVTADQLYRLGLITLKDAEDFKTEFLKIRKNKKTWNLRYSRFIQNKKRLFKNNRPRCIQDRQLAVNGQCCGKRLGLPDPYYEIKNPNCGKKTSQTCTSHSECCSQYCDIEPGNTVGACTRANSCFELIPFNDECGVDISPYCDPQDSRIPAGEVSTCISINYQSSNAGECIPNGSRNTCTSNDDCCSDKCENNRCVQKSMCFICSKEGEKPDPSKDKKCCPGLYESTNGKCMKLMPMFSLPSFTKVETPIFKKIINTLSSLIVSKAHAEIVCNGGECSEATGEDLGMFSAESEQAYRDEIKKCYEGEKKRGEDIEKIEDSSEAIAACVKSVEDRRKQEQSNDFKDKQKGLSQNKFSKIFGIPAFSAQIKSDVQKCEFNSFADAWLGADATERNATVVLLGFEVMLSGVGTADMINFTSSNKEITLYAGLKEIMESLRNNRMSMYEKLSTIDKEMACSCMDVLGVNTFSEEKIQAYRDNCPGGDNIEEIDGSRESNTENRVKDVDKGVSGIAQEELIIKWQQKRRDIQLEFFQSNSNIESKFEKFIDDYNKIDWTEHTVIDRRIKRYTDWKLTVLGSIAVLVVGAAASLATAGLIAVAAGFGASLGVAGTLLAVGGSALGLGGIGFFIGDLVYNDGRDLMSDVCGKWSGVFVDTRTCTQTLHWEEYKDTIGTNRCNVKRRRMHCIQNQYAPFLDNAIASNPEAVQQFNNQSQSMLLDIWLPEFFPKNEANQLIQSHQITNKQNNAFDAAVAKLKRDSKPDAANFVKYFTEEISNEYKVFVDSNNNFLPRYTWDQSKIDMLKTAIKKYARCGFNPGNPNEKSFDDCGQTFVDSNKAKKLVGFGYYIQSEEDAELFADYVYQMHFFWPKIANTQFKAYPPMGFQAYMDGILLNMQILGSKNALNALNFAELFNVFESDLQARKSRYGAKGLSANLGESSRNSKFSKKLLKSLKVINFSTGEGIEEFNKQVGSSDGASSGLTKADIGVVNAVRSHAASLKKRVERNNAIEKALLSTPRGKKQIARQEKFTKRFSSPADRIFKELSKAEGTSKLSSGSSESKQKVSTFNIPSRDYDFSLPNYNSGSKFNPGGQQVTNTPKTPSHGLSDTQLTNMLKAAKKDKSLYKVDPNDTLFKVVSKAYKRNLDRVLLSTKQVDEIKIENKKKKLESDSNISEEKKKELKSLLGK